MEPTPNVPMSPEDKDSLFARIFETFANAEDEAGFVRPLTQEEIDHPELIPEAHELPED